MGDVVALFGEKGMQPVISKYMLSRKFLKKISLVLFWGTLNLIWLSHSFAADAQPKAVWYRYYDKGIANISSSITPAHIRHGYEALDNNMQVIQRARPYNAEKDQQQEAARAVKAQRHEQNTRLKRAYGSSSVATNKRDEYLSKIKKQISTQQTRLKTLQNDRILLKRQEIEYFRKGTTVPFELKQAIQYNSENINQTKNNIVNLQNSYRKTYVFYEDIIQRLKSFE